MVTETLKQADQEIDDLLKVLSLAALFFKEIPEGYPQSAVYVAIGVIILAIGSKGFFVLLNFFVTAFLIWIAFQSSDPKIIGFAFLYGFMSFILLGELDEPISPTKYLLGSTWWLGQIVINGIDLKFVASPGPFTYLFFGIAVLMTCRCLLISLRLHLHNKNNAKNTSNDG